MRISDWSSDVCSSDLVAFKRPRTGARAKKDARQFDFAGLRGNEKDRAILGRPVLKRGAIGADGIGEIIRDKAIPLAPDQLFRNIGAISCIQADATLATSPLRPGRQEEHSVWKKGI